MYHAFFAGFQLCLGLIITIGAQNAFLLRQGLSGRYVALAAGFCALSDTLLIAAGVAGFGLIQARLPWLPGLLTWAGVVFLLLFGARAFREAWRGGADAGGQGPADAPAQSGGQSGAPSAGPQSGPWPMLAILAVLTWANPHVWLESVVLIGGVSLRFPGAEWAFGGGAAAASWLFFFALAYGARLLAPWLSGPKVARWLDASVGLLMWSLAARLVWAA